MKIAYFIMLHKHPELFKKLFKAIYHSNNYYLVHIDKKADSVTHEIVLNYINDYPNAFALESQRVSWGGYSQVEVQLRGIEKLLKTCGDWDFFINLSGQDFPLKPQDEIINYLEFNKKKNFINAVIQKKTIFRIRILFFEFFKIKVIPIPLIRSIPSGIIPYYGSGWFILSREFCEYLKHSKLSRKFQRFFKFTISADEGFFHTLIMNSCFYKTVIQDNKRFIKWNPGAKNPIILTNDYYNILIESNAFFARKFDMTIDKEIVNKLEKYVN